MPGERNSGKSLLSNLVCREPVFPLEAKDQGLVFASMPLTYAELCDLYGQPAPRKKPGQQGPGNAVLFAEYGSDAVFDPLKDKTQKKAGSYSYNSGRHQGGESGETFMRVNKVYRGGRPVTLEKQDPYLPKLSSGIKIRS